MCYFVVDIKFIDVICLLKILIFKYTVSHNGSLEVVL